ncbi:hypothetical protein ACFL6I_05575 [candidate division KSB1 bacterium]
MDVQIEHPKSGKIVVGRQLNTGEEIRDGDVFASETGCWEDDPSLQGSKIDEGCIIIWVRPQV